MKIRYMAVIVLLVTSQMGEAQVTSSVSKPIETAEETGYFFGLQRLIDMADAIVILRINRNLSSSIRRRLYSEHECLILQTLKGDIPEHSLITLQLHGLNNFVSLYPLGSQYLIFLTKKVTEDDSTVYRMIMFDEAQIELPDFLHGKAFESKTIEEQMKILIKDAIDYKNKMYREKMTLLKGILDNSEDSRESWSGDSLNITLSFDDNESTFIRLSGPELPLPYEKVSEMFKRIRADDDIDLSLVYQALVGPQYTLRAEAATYLGTHGNETSIPYLIDALSDLSMHDGALYTEAGMATTRYRANESLKKLAGQDFGFVWDDPIERRSEAVVKWRKWYSQQGKSSHTFYKNYEIDVPDDNYIIMGMRGMVPGNNLVLDLNINELRIYSSYEKSSLVLTRNLSSVEADLILSIFESKEYESVPERNMKVALDAQEIEITSVIYKREKHIHHILPDDRTLKHIINIYHELDSVPRR